MKSIVSYKFEQKIDKEEYCSIKQFTSSSMTSIKMMEEFILFLKSCGFNTEEIEEKLELDLS